MAARFTAVLLTATVVFPCVCEELQYDSNNHADDDVTLMQLYVNDARPFENKRPAKSKITKGWGPEKIRETKVAPRLQLHELARTELCSVLQRLRADAVISVAHTSGGGLALACSILVPVVVLVIVILTSPSKIRSKEDVEHKFELHWYHYVLFAAITMLGPMATDIILPAFSDIADDLRASHFMVSLAMPVNMLVRGTSMVVIGALSDRFGQKKMMLVSLVLFVGGSIISMTSPDIQTMLAGRVLQGLGEASDALVQAVVRLLVDEPHERMRVLSVLQSLQPVSVIVAPLVGSVLATCFGWRSIYCFLWGAALLSLIGYVLIVPETKDVKQQQPLLEQLSICLCTKEAWPILVPCTMIFTVLGCMLCNSAFVLDDFGLSTLGKGLLLATMPPFVAFGAMTTVTFFQGDEGQSLFITLRRAMGFECLLLFCTFSIGMTFVHSLWIIMASFYSITFSVGLCVPTLATLYLEPLKDSCGLAGGVLNGAQFIISALILPFSASNLETHGIRAMFMVFMTIHGVCQISFWIGSCINHQEWNDKAKHQEAGGAATSVLSKSGE